MGLIPNYSENFTIKAATALTIVPKADTMPPLYALKVVGNISVKYAEIKVQVKKKTINFTKPKRVKIK